LLNLLEDLKDDHNEELISFENLGFFLQKLGIFKALKF